MPASSAAAVKRFDPKGWKKTSKTLCVPVRLIDGSEYEFEFRILHGDAAIALKRDVFALEKESRELVKDEKKDGDEDGRSVETSVKLAEIDQRTIRTMTKACLVEEGLEDEDIDRLVIATGGVHSKFGEAVYRACGMPHPKDMLRLMRPDFFEDLPFLSHAKRGRIGGK